MHDIDRTQMEFANDMPAFESEQFEFSQQESFGGYEVFSEEQEMELAQELLAVNSEAELNYFLGNLIRSAGSAIGKAVRSPVGQAIGGMLKGVAKKALPMAGTALGAWVGGPLGAKIGGGLASMAGNALGLEAESMGQEEMEFEGARQFVRLAADVCKRAASAAPNADPHATAQAATLAATKHFAPGLLHATATTKHGGAAGASAGHSGRWVRRGNQIILYGA